nr:synaptobrevin, longin-like domain protein [Tanacetum cinerariifolium]
MALTFADTHNMITYLTKSDASEGFNQIIDFLNASSIQKRVIITEDTVHQALRLDDAERIYCLPNEEIFTELARMGYEKPSTKLTFYKAFFSAQWKFLIHTILQCMSAKRTTWNKFSSSMASAVICLSTEELEEEESRALKRKTESFEEKAAKKQKLDKEVEELKKHLQIVPNDDDDVYTEATPLSLKVPVVDYEIHTDNNKPYYKIIRADGSHQLFLSFLSLLRNFDREDLEMLWQIVQERFASSKPKNFSDDFLLTTLKEMFEKPDVEA